MQAIRDDMDNLRKPASPGVMLILTGHPAELAEEDFRYLAENLGVDPSELVTSSFPITPWPGEDRERIAREFAVIGILVTG